ncbi:MAG: FecR domain-containing protein [Verrucomicrobiota bacterium]
MTWKVKFSALFFLSILGLGTGSIYGAVEFQEGEITTIKNIVEHDSGTGPAPVKQSEMIHEKSKVSTEAASMAELTFGDSTITRMGANTMFSFQSKERLVKLDRGTVLINTPPGAGGATVDCGGVTGAVTGTTFLASRAGDGKVMFVLLEGSPMKLTSGGVVTTIKPGQAASVGLATPESGGGDKGGGDKAGGDKASGDKGGGDQGGGDKGGGEKGTAGGGGGEKGGPAPAPAEKPRPVQVFDVDVKKMVDSTPLIRDFAKPLPSAEKIQATVEVQQNKVSEGKMESLGMEVVAVKADGDLMVGSPKIEMEAPPAKEEGPAPRIEEGMAKNEGGGPGEKLDVATAGGGPGPGPDNLDIATAAGPGEGPAPIVAQDAPRVDAPRVEIPAPPPAVFVPPAPFVAPVITSITIRANDATRIYGEENPAFALRVVAGSLQAGDSVVATFRTPADPTSVVGPYDISIGSYSIVSSSGADVTAKYRVTLEKGNLNLAKAAQTLTIAPPAPALTGGTFTLAAAGGITGPVTFSILNTDGRANVRPDGAVTLGKILGADTLTVRAEVAGSANYLAGRTDLTVALGRDETAILAANPTRQLINGPSDSATVAALAKFFYFTGKAVGVAGPSRFFSDLSSSTRSLSNYSDRSVALYDGRPGEFYAMGTLNGAGSNHDITLGSTDTVIFANRINLGQAGLDSRVLVQVADHSIPDFNAAGYTSELSAADLAFKADGTAATSALPFYVLSTSLAINPADAMGMFAGDYKAYLTYMDSAGAGQTINLLDRIGTSATDLEGSPANGITATFSDYATGQAINSATGDPIAGTFQPGSGNTLLQGTMGAILPTGTFFMTVGDLSEGGLGILDRWSVSLVQRVKMSVLDGAGKSLTLISGVDGTAIDGTLWDVGQANLKFMSAGLMAVNDSEFYNLGSQLSLESAQDLSLRGIAARGEAVGGTDVNLSTGGSLSLKNSKLLVNGGLTATAAVGPVKLDGEAGDALIQAARNVVISGADLVETSAGGAGVAPAPTSLAVVRTGDSLEMRNVVIRGFSETKLESTKAGSTGRVLLSGSSVRDFKIKELAGMAVNADAKIQMMAYDATGGSEGTMTIEGRLPVAAKLASAIDNTLTGTLRDHLVDAKEIELAARNINLSNATMVAMDAINVRAQTILVQNSFMTVIRNTGSINMYVQSGLVNTTFGGAVVSGQANFAGLNTFTIGNNTFNIGNQGQLDAAYGGNLTDTISRGNNTPTPGKLNVLRL